jgi:hypothetical protein
VNYEGVVFLGVARREKLSAAKVGMSREVFVFRSFERIDVAGIRDCGTLAFQYATHEDKGSVPRGVGGSVWAFSVAIVPTVDEETSRAVRTQAPPKHFAGAEIPAVVELGTRSVHSFEKTPIWGAAYYRGFRKTIKELLTP